VIEQQVSCNFPRLTFTLIHEDGYLWQPQLKLSFPVVDRRQGHCDQERPRNLVDEEELGDEGNCLNGFSKAHLIGKDDTPILKPSLDEPLYANGLVWKEGGATGLDGI
jgi:hypothetical protein